MTRPTGRHRLSPPRLSLAQRLGAASLLILGAGLATAVWPTAADAVAPVQTAWWNTSGADSGTTTPPGGLHISVAPGGPTGSGQVLAFGAVLYRMADGASGTLELKISGEGVPNPNPDYPDQASQPNINLVACPTTQSWKAGADQAGPGPTYDCTHGINGNLSADGKTVSFFIDTNGQKVPGELSLAIVPVFNDTAPVVRTEVPGVDMTEPFSVDVSKPAADSLMITSPAVPAGGPQSGGGTTAPAGSTGTSTSTSANTATGQSSSGGSGPMNISVPPAETTTPTDGSTGTAPQLATTTPAAAPAAAVTPATDSTRRDAAIALLILLAVALVLMNNSRAPRLGRQGLAALAAAGAAGTPTDGAAAGSTPALDAATLALLAGYGSRGLGRFAKVRSQPPRPLV